MVAISQPKDYAKKNKGMQEDELWADQRDEPGTPGSHTRCKHVIFSTP